MQHQKNFLSAESVLVNLRILSLLGKTVLLLKGADGFFVQKALLGRQGKNKIILMVKNTTKLKAHYKI